MAQLEVKPNDLTALQAIRDAMFACNSADTVDLQYQSEGTFGLMYAGFIHAATAVLGTSEHAERLMNIIIDCGEDVAWSVNCLNQELCGVCNTWIENPDTHCSDCGTCKGDKHSADCSEMICMGHQTTDGPMGISAYCDDSCRPATF